jgi:Ca2+-binding EF-hand superfamily protein
MFKLFDKNGDGVFVQLEFECAFTVLEIPFAKADLRRLISLGDANKDGRIDFDEFHDMLYKIEGGYKEEDLEKAEENKGFDIDASYEDIESM